jgi:hypothetical protein
LGRKERVISSEPKPTLAGAAGLDRSAER